MAGQDTEEKAPLEAAGNTDSADGAEDSGEGISAAERVRQENRRQRRAAAARRRQRRQRELDEAKAVGLDASEMVDDALARSSDKAAKWFTRHFKTLQWLIVAGVLAWGGTTGYRLYTAKQQATASDALLAGPEAMNGIVLGPEQNEIPLGDENVAKYASVEEQLQAAQAAFEQARGKLEGSGVEALAVLGRAAALFDQEKYEEAAGAYEQALALEITRKVPELQGRAEEGIAMCLEAEGKREEALEAYRKLGEMQIEGFTNLAKFEQARLLVEHDGAKALALLDEVLSAAVEPAQRSLFAAPRYTEQRARELKELLLATQPELAAAAVVPAPATETTPSVPSGGENVPPAPPASP